MIHDCAICGDPTNLSPAPLVTQAEGIRLPPSMLEMLADRYLCGHCDYSKRQLRSRNAPAAASWRDLAKQVKDPAVQGLMDYLLNEQDFRLAEEDSRRSKEARRKVAIANVKATTGEHFEGYTIKDYRVFVSEELVVGAVNGSSARVFPEAESEALRRKLAQAKESVLERMAARVVDLDANAIIGLRVEYPMFGDSVLGVVASGTAVVVARDAALAA